MLNRIGLAVALVAPLTSACVDPAASDELEGEDGKADSPGAQSTPCDAGALSAPVQFRTGSTTPFEPQLAFDGVHLGHAWFSGRNAGYHLLDPASLAYAGTEGSISAVQGDIASSRLVPTGGRFVWDRANYYTGSDNATYMMWHLSRDHTSTNQGTQAWHTGFFNASIVDGDANTWGIALEEWDHQTLGDRKLVLARVRKSDYAWNQLPLGTLTTVSTVPTNGSALAANPITGEYIVAFGRASDGDIVTTRVLRTGHIYAAEQLVASTPGTSRQPALLWNGHGFTVTWADQGGALYLALLDGNGAPTGPARQLAASGSELTVAWSGNEYGITYVGPNGPVFVVADAAGQVIGQPVKLQEYPYQASKPRVVWVGDAFVVGWIDDRDEIGTYALQLARACERPQ